MSEQVSLFYRLKEKVAKMGGRLERDSTFQSNITVATSLDACTPIGLGAHAGYILYVPSSATSGTLTWYVCHKREGVYLPLTDKDAAAVTTTVAASNAYELPYALFGATYAKAVHSAATDDAYLVMRKG